jgi:hypothetical protein
MNGSYVIAIVAVSLGILLTRDLQAQVAETGQRSLTAPTVSPHFRDYINGHPPVREQHPWGLFLGTTWTPDDIAEVEKWVRTGALTNPFTGQPFKEGELKIFAFGHDNPAEVTINANDFQSR